jgi:hypothetical protein
MISLSLQTLVKSNKCVVHSMSTAPGQTDCCIMNATFNIHIQNTCVIGNILLAAVMESENSCCLLSCYLSGWVRVCSHPYIKRTKGEYGSIYPY